MVGPDRRLWPGTAARQRAAVGRGRSRVPAARSMAPALARAAVRDLSAPGTRRSVPAERRSTPVDHSCRKEAHLAAGGGLRLPGRALDPLAGHKSDRVDLLHRPAADPWHRSPGHGLQAHQVRPTAVAGAGGQGGSPRSPCSAPRSGPHCVPVRPLQRRARVGLCIGLSG